VSFTSLCILCTNAGLKLFCWAKPAWFHFSSFNFLFKRHILSINRAALMQKCDHLFTPD
jgi:hypothetical protein